MYLGRAGRVSDGHCFRMISSRMFGDLIDYCTPEMKVSFVIVIFSWDGFLMKKN